MIVFENDRVIRGLLTDDQFEKYVQMKIRIHERRKKGHEGQGHHPNHKKPKGPEPGN